MIRSDLLHGADDDDAPPGEGVRIDVVDLERHHWPLALNEEPAGLRSGEDHPVTDQFIADGHDRGKGSLAQGKPAQRPGAKELETARPWQLLGFGGVRHPASMHRGQLGP